MTGTDDSQITSREAYGEVKCRLTWKDNLIR